MRSPNMKNNTPNKPRRRLFTRLMENLPPLTLTKRDLSILELLDEYRFLNTPQIKVLIGGSKRNLSERLSRLFHHGYLDRPAHQRELRTDGYRNVVYALSQQGAHLLSEQLGDAHYVSHHLAENNKTAKQVHLAHTLMISQFHACLMLACRDRDNLMLASWKNPERALLRVLIGGQHIPVIPDAYFILKDPSGGSAYFFLEADRGTMTQNRFLRKLQAYWRLHITPPETKTPSAFRVLTVTTSQKRVQNLVATAKGADSKHKGSLMFYFTSQDTYNLDHPETILNRIWHSPADGAMHSLLEGKPARQLTNSHGKKSLPNPHDMI